MYSDETTTESTLVLYLKDELMSNSSKFCLERYNEIFFPNSTGMIASFQPSNVGHYQADMYRKNNKTKKINCNYFKTI